MYNIICRDCGIRFQSLSINHTTFRCDDCQIDWKNGESERREQATKEWLARNSHRFTCTTCDYKNHTQSNRHKTNKQVLLLAIESNGIPKFIKQPVKERTTQNM